ncbi:MAG: energy-coupling factor transport system permease protein [Solirubrobacteraceae bacterium]|nr:energy-coupling factor transport system permease protein [Solirubrobacteraceae bacterium]
MIYARRASPLHAARPVVGIAWCAALAAAALVVDHPLVLAGLLVALVGAALAAGVGERLARTARMGLPLALAIALIEPLLQHDGLTLIARLGDLGPLGRLDITLEAVVYGSVLGLRALVVVAAFGLYAAAVDPDEVLRLFRRRGLRSALTVTIATRMVGVLEADARRLADGQRCRGTRPPSRMAVVRAVTSGALDRALDVAAALELRGYGARRPAARARAARPWSRHDLAFAASAVGIVALVVLGELGGASAFSAFPRLHGAGVAASGALAVALVLVALAPFADRRGIAR